MHQPATPLRPAASAERQLLHSFDVFDTLITRCWWRPEDLFIRLGARLAEAGLLHDAPERFAARRMAAEAALRAQHSVEEVTLAAIHAELARIFDWNTAQQAAAAALEIDTEEEAARPVAANAARLSDLWRSGAEIALLSDTYLDRADLLRLLRRAGIAVPADRVFASSTLDATKRTGRMFRFVSAKLGIPVRRILHRGDHPRSDLAVPRAAGIRAELCTEASPTRFETLLHGAAARHPPLLRSALAGGARAARLSADPPTPHARTLWAVGADVAGPLLAGFVLWLLDEARRGGIARLHFVSRDGQILLRIAETLLPALGWNIGCRYLLGSRQAWHLPAMERLDEAALDWLARSAPQEPLRSVLARAELAPHRLGDSLARHGFAAPGALDRPAPLPRLLDLLRDAEVEAAILAAAAGRRRAALGYLRQEGLLGGGSSAIVDLGWHGRLQRSLHRLLECGAADDRPAALTGFYLALRSRPTDLAPETMHAFVQAPDFLHAMNPVLLEIFCAADHGTVRRYVARPGGGFTAELAEARDERVLSWGLETLQGGIMAFARELAEALRRSGGSDVQAWIPALREAGLAAYDMFRRTPTEAEAQAFGSFPHADGQAHEVWGECAPRLGPVARLRLGLGLGDPAYAGHWPEASVRRGGGRLADALFALKRLRRRR